MEKLGADGVTCLCGELSLERAIADLAQGGRNDANQELLELLKVRHQNIGYGTTPGEAAFHQDALKQLLEKGMAIGCTDTNHYNYLAEGLPSIANSVLQTTIAGLAAAGILYTVAKNNKISRKEFLQIGGISLAGLGVYGAILLSPLPTVFKNHNRRFPPAEKNAERQVVKELQAEQDGKLDTYFTTKAEYTIRLRNAVIALNTWCLIDRYAGSTGEFNENLYLFAGAAHGGINDILAEGPYFSQDLVRDYAMEFFGKDLEKLYRTQLAGNIVLEREKSTDQQKNSDQILKDALEQTETDVAYTLVNACTMFADPYTLGSNSPARANLLTTTRAASAKQVFMQTLDEKLAELLNLRTTSPEQLNEAVLRALQKVRNMLDPEREYNYARYKALQERLGYTEERYVYNETPYDKFVRLHIGGSIDSVIQETVEQVPPETIVVGTLHIGGTRIRVHRAFDTDDGLSNPRVRDYIVDVDGKMVVLGDFDAEHVITITDEGTEEAFSDTLFANRTDIRYIVEVALTFLINPGLTRPVRSETYVLQNDPPNIYFTPRVGTKVYTVKTPSDSFMSPTYLWITEKYVQTLDKQ